MGHAIVRNRYGNPAVILNYRDGGEWIVTDLITGISTGNPDCQSSGIGIAGSDRQYISRNGRLWMADGGSRVLQDGQWVQQGPRLVYFDPPSNRMKCLPGLLPADEDYLIYSLSFSNEPNSNKLYAGSSSKGLRGPAIVEIDTNTLAWRVLKRVGEPRNTYSYAYHIAVDYPWLYATALYEPARIVSLNILTNETRTLFDSSTPQWASSTIVMGGFVLAGEYNRPPVGLVGFFIASSVYHRMWLVDGDAYSPARMGIAGGTYDPSSFPVGKAFRDFSDMSGRGPVAFRDYYPDLKDLEFNLDSASPSSEGRSIVYWRPNTNVSFTGVEVPSRDLPGVAVSRWSMEQLFAVNETLMIGNMQQYLGLFYYRSNDSNVTATLTCVEKYSRGVQPK
jgi:hypothetical protein